MKKNRASLNIFGQSVLKCALCLAFGGFMGAQTMYAEPLSVAQAAQTSTVTGQVIDDQGEPLIGVSVKVKGQQVGVATDFDGKYAIKAKAGDEITFSYVGMREQAVTVGKDRVINVTLEPNSKVMEEIVVIGYGTQKKGDITSAVASVKAEDFAAGKIGDAAELVKGKIAGLSVVNSSGNPTAQSSIMLRGINTIIGSVSPLVLIDGIEGGLNTVAPENIASIDVLKDASAAAIYGTRGANGVILITTKSGSRGAKASASYADYFSFSNWSKTPDFMDTHDIIYGRTNQQYLGYDTDWLKAVTRKHGFKHNHSFMVSGGTENATYSANIAYNYEEGVMRKSDNENLKMQMDYTQYLWNDILKVNFNALLTRQKYTHNSADYVYRQALIHNPSEPVFNEDGSYYENFNKFQYYNPVSIENETDGNTRNRFMQMVGNITLEPITGWQTTLSLSWGEHMSTSESWTSPEHYTLVKDGFNGSASKSEGTSVSKSLEVTSKYFKNFNNKHRFDALVGYSYLYNINDGFNAGNTDFSTTAYKWNNLGNGSFLTDKDHHAWMGSYRNDDTLIGFFGRVSYGYDNRYNVLASLRYEGSSKFGDNNKWALFPSISAGWNVTNEEFMAPARDILNNLRLRVGYGVTGQTPTSSYLSMYTYDYDPYGDVMNLEGEWVKTLIINQNENKDIKWETTQELNVGIDYGLFNDRISGTLDVYRRETHDLLYSYAVPVPPNLYGTTLANVGDMRNTGVEFAITGIPVQTKDFQWTTTVTLSRNFNKLLNLNNDLYETDNFQEVWGVDGFDPISVPSHCMEVGTGFGDFWGLKSVGVDKDGFVLVEVKDEDTGEWTVAPFTTDLNKQENRQRLGSGMPKLYLGWNNTFYYKGFDLNMQFTGQFGYKIMNVMRCFYENNIIAYNPLKSAANLYPAINADGTPYIDPETGEQKMVTLSKSMSQGFWSDHLEKGDFFKLTNVTLGYTFPLKGSFKNYISSLRIYGSATNLFCITKYSGLDPEVSTSFWSPGVDNRNKYPTTRSYTVGLNVTF